MTRTAQEAAGSHFKGRPAVCCSLCSSTEQLVCCHYVTDTHQRSYCSADKVKAIHIPNDLRTLPSFLCPEPQQTACAGSEAWKEETCSISKRNRTQVYSCPWSRMQTTVFHGSQFKKKENNKKSGRCKYRAHLPH